MSAGLDFGPIRDDDELLDRLGSRRVVDDASVENDSVTAMLAAWTAEIDADEREHAADVGPLGLRRVPGLGEATPRVKVVQVRRARAVGVLGALALTVSGGGVAAALTNGDIVPVREAVAKVAAKMVRVEPTVTQTAAAAPAAALPQVVDSIEEAVDNRDYPRARGMIDVLRRVMPSDPASPQITQQVEALAERIDVEEPRTGVASPIKKEVTATTATAKIDPTSPSTTLPAPATTGPTASAPVSTAPTTPDKTGDKTTDKPTAKPTPDTDHPTTPETAQPVPTTTPGVGNAGGGQSAGTGTSTSTSPAKSPHISPSATGGSAGATAGTPTSTRTASATSSATSHAGATASSAR